MAGNCPAISNAQARPSRAELSESDGARFRAFERTRYHALAESYDHFFTPVTTNAIAPRLKTIGLKPGDRLLDVACGSGALAAAAREQGAQATGIDLTPGMIALWRRPAIPVSISAKPRSSICRFPMAHSMWWRAISASATFPIPSAPSRNAHAC